MYNLNYFEKLANTAIFSKEKKEVWKEIGKDSLALRKDLSNKSHFSDTTKVVNFKSCE
ncbi:Uncharacterised protein [Legionella beliardensis]|uniref:Uncharacterized protein n=1 Tax=Legionella beliardensis TaxID=91822 RepID=A0A378JPE4_9GAMM|nr:hypothetical protein [Legionella beliardensis]STX55465.1 Uncharacterised protein [Legionella beliardensis]STX55538.1 Uncharacterised protein [Legionella beliardensis]